MLTGEEAIARVVGHVREDISGHNYGVAFMDPSVDLWHVQFPQNECGKRTVLECSRCHAVKSVSLTEIETAIFESKRALTRHCECGNSSTIWKETSRDAPVEQKRIEPGEIPGPEPVAPPAREKRKDRRTAMKSVACIRYAGQEEVVVCEDMSRGGFRIKSRKEYPKGTQIEAAVPYMQGNVNIFVPAQIVYHQELSAASHRHGVAYLKIRRNTNQK